MFIENKNYYYIEEFEKYGIIAVYTKKIAGNMSDYCPIENQIEGIQKKNREKLLKELNLTNKQEVMAFQTHSNNVKIIDEDTTKYYYKKEEDIDGFLTKRKDIAIFTFYADCLPIFVYDKENQVIGVWHSGWPGTFKQIMKSGLLEMKKNYGTKIENVIMALGIGIGQKDYEVGNEFYDKFMEKFGKSDGKIVKESFWFNEETKKYHFDNTKFNELMALKFGIKKENLIIANESTFNEKFHSYRREGKNAGRAIAMISFK
ncbi:peptidoglycan editing factor PgeF [Leptotrichia buccalis]